MKALVEGLNKSIVDALYYLERPGTSPEDEEKARAILRARADVWKPGTAKAIRSIKEPGVIDFTGAQIAIWVGHEPGGGTTGERAWNTRVASAMKALVEKGDGEARIFFHKIRGYGARQTAMRRTMLEEMPDADLAFELHYDAVSYSSAHGHHFQYRGAKRLAECIRDAWQERFPNSRARENNGIKHNPNGRGSGFLRKCPCWAVLVEPFFRSNPEEWSFFKGRVEEVAEVYLLGAGDFLDEQD